MTDSTDRKLAFGLFVLTFVTCGYFFGGGGWNQNAQFSLTRAIVEEHTFAIDRYALTTGDVSRHGGRTYANKSPGVSFLALVPYFVIHALEQAAGSDPSAPLLVTLNLYLCTLLVSGLSVAALIALFFTTLRGGGVSRRNALAMALLLAFGTPLLPFSTLLFAHAPSALLLFAAFVWIFRDRPGSLVAAGVAAGLAGLTNYLAVPLIGLFAVVVLARRGMRAGAAFTLAAVPAMLLLAWYQRVAFGGWLRTPIETMDQRFVSRDALLGIVRLPAADALYGITFSPYRGLFFVSPVLLLAIIGAWHWWRSRAERLQFAASLGVIAWFFAFNASFNGWEGGFTFGPRYLIPAIPFLGLLMARVPARPVALWLILGAVSIANCLSATAVDPQPSGSIPRPLTQYIYPLLIHGEFSPEVPLTPPWSAATIRGHVAVNPHSADQYKPYMLHAPESVESEWASFNLGEWAFGAGSLLSLLPIALWVAAGSFLLYRRALSNAPQPVPRR